MFRDLDPYWIRIPWLYQVGNTSSRKNTEVQQLGPRLALGWVTIQGLDVNAVDTNTVKSGAKKEKRLKKSKRTSHVED